MLHGNPIRNLFGGIKIAACGELGMGVGEEERGSGEREVLEGLVGRIEGLVDLVVGKFGTADANEAGSKGKDAEVSPGTQWLGTGNEPGAEDGAIFLGVGALSRHSLRNIASWMEDLYTWGEAAYGVAESPTATRAHPRRPKRTSLPPPPADVQQPAPEDPSVFKPPPPLIGPGRNTPGAGAEGGSSTPKHAENEAEVGGMDKFVSYLKMGYGTYWTLGSSPSGDANDTVSRTATGSRDGKSEPKDDAAGHYLIGLMGEVEDGDTGSGSEDAPLHDDIEAEYNSRTVLRTVIVEIESEGEDRPESTVTKDLGSQDKELAQRRVDSQGNLRDISDSAFDSQDRNKTKKLRVVVYVNKPFIFTFLFELRNVSLTFDALYRSLHYQLAPLRKPLITSTAYRPGVPDTGSAAAQIYDLIWDPRTLTVHSTIPNIPDPIPNPRPQIWSRIEALNTHTQLLNNFVTTRNDLSQMERTSKTSRGWWIVWRRITERETRLISDYGQQSDEDLSNSPSDQGDDEVSPTQEISVRKEIFLIRKAGEHGSTGNARGVSSSYITGGWADGASRLAQGIGVDTKKYIEGLLSLNR
jgi:hypothetical protein